MNERHINWQCVVRSHKDFVWARPDYELTLGVCMRDGCGSSDFYGQDAWRQAAEYLGFDREYVDRTDVAEIDLDACESEKARVFWRPDPTLAAQTAHACGYRD